MKSLSSICIFFILIISFITILQLQITKAEEGNIIYVDDSGGANYTTIQAAIDAASEGDTIYVYGGTYSEKIEIDKTITLTGAGSNYVTISGSGGNTINIINDSVKISGFTIKNTGYTSMYSCVFLDYVENCTIYENLIKSSGNGVYFSNSNNNTIVDNTIEYNNVGIYISKSNSNTIKSNYIQNNYMNGIYVYLISNNNTFYLNDFSKNPNGNAIDYISNNWDYNSEGNYWDDYTGYDNNTDGIGDIPYNIIGGTNKDNYPLGDFLSPKPTAYIDSISPKTAYTSDTIHFSGHGTDDGTIIGWEWKIDGNIKSTSESFSSSGFSVGTHFVSFRVQDNENSWSDPATSDFTINSETNEKPSAEIVKPTESTYYYSETVEFLGSGSDDDGTIVAYSWRSVPTGISSSTSSFSLNNILVGNYTVYFKVRDNYGDWSQEVSKSLKIIKDSSAINNPPVAVINLSHTALVNQTVIIYGTNSYDPNIWDSIRFNWDLGDGTTDENTTLNHIYNSTGNYSIKLTVTDSQGLQNTSYSYINIELESSNGNNLDNNEKGIPGFEISLIFIIILFLICLYHFKKK